MTFASHANLRAVSGAIREPPWAGTDHGRGTGAGGEVVVGHGEHERGLHPRGWPVAGAGGAAAYLDQGLTTTGLGATGVALTIGAGNRRRQGADRGLQRRRSGRVQHQLIGEGAEFVGRRAREGDETFGSVGVSLELTIRAMGGQQCGTQRPDTLRSVRDPHVQQTLQDRRGSFLTQTRLQPGVLGDHPQRDRHTHSTGDSRRLDRRQVGASTLTDQTGNLPRTTPSRQSRRVFSDPPGRRPGL